jgi:hypothetical protein
MTSPSHDPYGNPSIIYQNPNFPFDLRAAQYLDRVPEGLVAGRQVLAEFLGARDLPRGDWFCYKTWDAAALILRTDDKVPLDEFKDAINQVSRIMDGLTGWAQRRPEMPDGYVEQWPDGMLDTGHQALRDIFNFSRTLGALHDKAEVSGDSKTALENVSNVFWEYFECIAFEMEASFEQVAVTDVRDRFDRGTTKPWEPAVTPENVEDPGVIIGSHRLPSLPESPGKSGNGGNGHGGNGGNGGNGHGGNGEGHGE